MGETAVISEVSRTIPHGRITDAPGAHDAAIDELLRRHYAQFRSTQPSDDPDDFDAAYSAAQAAGQEAFVWRGRQYKVYAPPNRQALVAEVQRMKGRRA
jgi:hypothetical protein